jgi:hypothetical protein
VIPTTVKQRDRVPAEARPVFCPCGKRLGHQWPRNGLAVQRYRGLLVTGTWTGARVTRSSTETGGKHLPDEDWVSVVCRRCGVDWQGRERYLLALVAGARPGERVTLGAVPRQPRPSRAW